MPNQSPFSTSRIHHIALRVADARESKTWLTTMLDFSVDREFQFAGLHFVWLSPRGTQAPVIELIGGPVNTERQLPENALDSLKESGLHHVCLQVTDIDETVSELQRRGVRIVIDVTAGAPGSGVEKGAFIADPWGNIFEFLQLADADQ
jgi:catechol 2,3-dioxygenase-like lactoylglutathione lyase family enzyme